MLRPEKKNFGGAARSFHAEWFQQCEIYPIRPKFRVWLQVLVYQPALTRQFRKIDEKDVAGKG